MRRVLLAVVTALVMTAWPAQAQLFPTNPFPAQPTPDVGTQTPVGDYSAFAHGWGRHGFGLKVNADGSAQATWRAYRWCTDPGVTGACDGMQGNLIQNGGAASLLFTSIETPASPRDWQPKALAARPPLFVGVQMPIARGSVVSTTDPKTLREGPVSLVLLPYNTATVVQEGDGFLVCGPDDAPIVNIDDMTPEQRERWEHRACGA